MKVLYLTPWPPSLKNGGEKHCYANLLSLALLTNVSIDYVGPPFDSSIFGPHENVFGKVLNRAFTFKDKIMAAFQNSATSLSALFNEFAYDGKLSRYDLIFIETTRCGFVFKYLADNSNTICCVHNVEHDFAKYNKANRLTQFNIRKSEYLSIQRSKKLLVMHEEDKHRLKQIYKKAFDYTDIECHPVCSLEPSLPLLPYAERNSNIVFSGSLDCYYNEIGIITFINTCWKQLADLDHTLVVTGRNPSNSLRDVCNSFNNIKLIPNPSNIEEVVRDAKLLILPDMSGSGMKLRVAEALSLGIPVVGTKCGLKGYDDIGKYGYAVDDVQDMAKVIRQLFTDDHTKLVDMSCAARSAWSSNYSFESFNGRIHTIVEIMQLNT